MIVKRILKLANIIERGTLKHDRKPVKFDMEHWRHSDSCGTAACIGGHTEIVFKQSANVALGLTDAQAGQLFAPDNYWNRRKYTAKRAVAVLRYLAKTGRVEWDAKKRK